MQKIYLEADEEITSVIDKIRQAEETEIVLIFPKKATITHSLVSLKLLKKQAEIFNKHLILVIYDEVGRYLAKSANFPLGKIADSGEVIFKEPTIKKTEEKAKEIIIEKTGKIEKEFDSKFLKAYDKTIKKVFLLPKFSLKKFLPIIIILAAVLWYLCFFILPKAEIKIVPKTEFYTNEVELAVDSNVDNINQDKNIIPGKLETKEIWVTKKKFDVKGEKEIGDRASGEIVVYNKFSSENITLPKETKFQAQGKTFLSLSDFEIPGAKVKGGKTIPGQVIVKVIAEKGGDQYNIKPSVFILSSLPPMRQKDIWGESKSEFSGGSSKKIKAISEEDLKRAKNELIKEGESQAKEQLKNNPGQGKMFIENAISADVLETKTEAKVNQEAVSFEMEGKIRIKTIIFAKEDLKNIIFRELNKKLEGKKMVVDNNLDEGVLYEVKNFDANLGKLIFIAKINKLVATVFDTKKLKTELFGLNKQQIQKKLYENKEIQDVKINFWPFWVTKMPTNKAKIKIILDIKK